MNNHPFFVLLRSGLWGTPAQTIYFPANTTDWTALMHTAQSHSVAAILFDGIQTLPPALRPPQNIDEKWVAEVNRIEQENESLNQDVPKLFTFYQQKGLTPILLQGQGIATTYLQPLHRQSQGINIYLGKEGYEIANQLLLEQQATPIEEETDKCFSFHLRNVYIKNHRILGRLNCPVANSNFQHITSQWYPLTTRDTKINKYRIALPPPSFNVLYTFVHALTNFSNDSMSLQQLCDWVRLLHTEEEHIERRQLRHQLQKLGLTTAVRAFGYIAVNYLGLPTSKLPFNIDEAELLGEALLKDIMTTDDIEFSRYPEKWKNKWHTFAMVMKRCKKLKPFAPREAFWYPLALLKKNLPRQQKQAWTNLTK